MPLRTPSNYYKARYHALISKSSFSLALTQHSAIGGHLPRAPANGLPVLLRRFFVGDEVGWRTREPQDPSTNPFWSVLDRGRLLFHRRFKGQAVPSWTRHLLGTNRMSRDGQASSHCKKIHSLAARGDPWLYQDGYGLAAPGPDFLTAKKFTVDGL